MRADGQAAQQLSDPRPRAGVVYDAFVLSPNAVASKWVNKEVGYWLEERGPERLLFVVAGGEVAWDEATQRFDPDRSDAALPLLIQRGVLPTEPLYVDADFTRGFCPQQHLLAAITAMPT